MSTRKQQLENLLRDPEFRHQFVADYVQEMVAAQIRAIREHRGWTQEQLGEAAAAMSQVQVSRLENPDYSGTSLKSLKRMAQAFDVGLIVRMASFSEFVDWIVGMSPERLVPPNYAEEQEQHRIHALIADAIAAELNVDDFQIGFSNIPTSTGGFSIPIRNMARVSPLAFTQGMEERQPTHAMQGGKEFALAA